MEVRERRVESEVKIISDVEVVRTMTADTYSGMIDAHEMKNMQTLSLFKSSDDWLSYLSSWLDLRSIGCLDTAIGHRQDRSTWLKCLRTIDTALIDDYEH